MVAIVSCARALPFFSTLARLALILPSAVAVPKLVREQLPP
jgi:hypothetical protein